jgi:hypothetical protein
LTRGIGSSSGRHARQRTGNEDHPSCRGEKSESETGNDSLEMEGAASSTLESGRIAGFPPLQN